MVSRFSKGLYSDEVEAQYITPYLNVLDEIITALTGFPGRHEIPYLDERSVASPSRLRPLV
jgi:hypothetical protein